MRRISVAARLGSRIRARRQARGWSQAKFAEIVDLTPNYVGSMERGHALPTLQTLLVVARALGVSPAQLLGEGAPRDEWLDRVMALAETTPADRRPLVLALLSVINTGGHAARPARPPSKRKE